MKKSALLITLFLVTMFAFGQRSNQKWYKNAIGARTENAIYNFLPLVGVTYDQFLTNTSSVELILLSDLATGTELSGLYKYIKSIPDVPASVRWYCGVGLHVGKWNATDMTAGPDGILGIGYTFDQLPFNVTLDWHPIINLLTSDSQYIFIPTKFGLSARYIIE